MLHFYILNTEIKVLSVPFSAKSTSERPKGGATLWFKLQSKCYITSGMTWMPFPPQLTFNQLLFSPKDPKQDIGRSSAEPTHTVIPSFQVQSASGMHFLLMSASCRRTASRLNCTPSHLCRRLLALFLSTALHCFYPLCLICCLA